MNVAAADTPEDQPFPDSLAKGHRIKLVSVPQTSVLTPGRGWGDLLSQPPESPLPGAAAHSRSVPPMAQASWEHTVVHHPSQVR